MRQLLNSISEWALFKKQRTDWQLSVLVLREASLFFLPPSPSPALAVWLDSGCWCMWSNQLFSSQRAHWITAVLQGMIVKQCITRLELPLSSGKHSKRGKTVSNRFEKYCWHNFFRKPLPYSLGHPTKITQASSKFPSSYIYRSDIFNKPNHLKIGWGSSKLCF